MTRAQRKLYQDALARTRSAAQQEGSAVGMGSRVGSRTKGGRRNDSQSSNVLMELRKAANHPLLFRTIFNEKKIAALAKDYVKEPEHADENLEHLKEDFAINSDAELSFLAHAWPVGGS